MTSADLKLSLEQAKRELLVTVQARDHWNMEIVRLQNLVKALAASVATTERSEKLAEAMQFQLGITEAVEAFVNQSPDPVTPIEVRNGLLLQGYQVGRYANPLAVVHQSLRRLAAAGRILEIRGRYTQSAGILSLGQPPSREDVAHAAKIYTDWLINRKKT